jgi:zinc protease
MPTTRMLRGVVLVTALLSFPAAAQYKPKGRPVDYKGHFSSFPSGMRLVVYEMPQLDRFAVAVSYDAGAVDDPAGKEGLAHLAEHLAFRGAPGGAAVPRIWERLVASGMRFNAFTAMEHTDYWIAGKPEELGNALRIEAARMTDPLAGVTDDDFAIERDVVAAEWRERYETIGNEAQWEWIRELVFAGHPYGRPAAGSPETLKAISLADLKAWMKPHYAPAGAVIVVVSPFPAEDAARRVMDAFEAMLGDPNAPVQPMAHRPPAMPAKPVQPGSIPTRTAPVGEPQLWVAWPVPGTQAGMEPQILAVTAYLAAYVNLQLDDLRARGSVGKVDANVEFMDGAGLLVVSVVFSDPADAGKMLDTVRFAAGKLKQVTFGLESLRDWLLVRAYVDLEDMDLAQISQYLRAQSKPDFVGDWSKRVAVQLGYGLDAFADRWLTPDRSSAVLVLPDRNVRARDLAGGPAAGHSYGVPLEDEAAAIPPPSPERVGAVLRAPALVKAERRTLENGLDVAFLQRGSLPVADVRLAIRTPADGTAGAPLGARRLGLAASGASFVAARSAGVGAGRYIHATPESYVREDRASSGNLADLIEAEGRWATNVTFSGPAFDQLKKYVRNDYARDDRSPLERTRRVLHDRLFPGHPYGLSVTAEAIDALSSGEASRWVSRAIRPERGTLLVVSDVAPSPEGWKWIEKRFGDWDRDGAGPVPPAPIVPLPAGRTVAVVERRGATQATVAVGFRMPPLGERDAPALDALQWLLESRLTQRIRVEEGVSYGVSVGVIEYRQAAALVVSAAVDAEAVARTVKTILGAAQDLAAAPLQPASAARARWIVARRFASQFETVGDAADALQTIALHGLPPDYYDKMPASIVSLDAARIQAAAKTLSPGHEAIVISGELSLAKTLAAAGMGSDMLPEPAR